MFIVNLTYIVALDQVDQHIPAHIDFLNAQYAAGHFLASGRKVPRTGGIILANAASLETLAAILEQDPFKQNNLADYEVIEFVPSKASDELQFLIS